MILNISVFALVACAGCLHSVSGASFSKVYVSSGQEIVPLEYIQYGAPAVSMPGPQIAQISAAPIGSVIPVASSPNLIPPCNTPCVLSGPVIPSVAQVAAATPNFVTYKSSVPAVVKNNEELTGYEYSYVVYDENTGDHKAQRESSDGAVVKGEYSLIQPDGYVREVHYTADDLNGFNAVVKNFLPTQVESKDDHKENNHPVQPCHEDNKELRSKNESLKPSENGEKHDTAHDSEPHYEHTHQETHEAVPSHEIQADKTSAKAPESSSSEESHEIIKDEHQMNPIETHEKKSEALTKGSPESSEEGESSEEDSVEEHKSEPPHDEHGPMTHEEQKAEEHTEHQFNEKPYHDIIKCVQTAKFPTPLTYIIFNKPC